MSYRRAFDAKAEDVIGPVTDHQGTWISALIPINDMATGRSELVTENDAQAMARKAVDFYRKNGTGKTPEGAQQSAGGIS